MKLTAIGIIILLAMVLQYCVMPSDTDNFQVVNNSSLYKMSNLLTGSVEVKRLNNKGNSIEDKLMFAEFDAHDETVNQPDKGLFIFRVLNLDSTLHREINIELSNVIINPSERCTWFAGKVVSDTKGCNGNGIGGHEENCSNCSGEETDGHSETCDGSDSGHDEACIGGDGETHSDCEGGGGDETSGGNNQYKVSGKYCRVGQILAAKVVDEGTPGVNGDQIEWKWFHPENPIVNVFNSYNVANWPHLCKKQILEGNLMIHIKN